MHVSKLKGIPVLYMQAAIRWSLICSHKGISQTAWYCIFISGNCMAKIPSMNISEDIEEVWSCECLFDLGYFISSFNQLSGLYSGKLSSHQTQTYYGILATLGSKVLLQKCRLSELNYYKTQTASHLARLGLADALNNIIM